MRIFHAVKHDDERILPALGADYIIEIAVLFRRSDRDDSLMRPRFRPSGRVLRARKRTGTPEATALFDHALQADVVPLLGHADPLESASAGLECLGNRVDAVNIVHEVFSVTEAEVWRGRPSASAGQAAARVLQAPTFGEDAHDIFWFRTFRVILVGGREEDRAIAIDEISRGNGQFPTGIAVRKGQIDESRL